jgi:hypothetical protein
VPVKITREKEQKRVQMKILNVLKKYSRAAGDRNQWRKVEAMSSELDQDSELESARESFEGGLYHVMIV